jgi:hypothetical protein
MGGWELWRQDDHGNEFLVATFASEDEARRALGEYTARGHKQTYAVRPAAGSGDRVGQEE